MAWTVQTSSGTWSASETSPGSFVVQGWGPFDPDVFDSDVFDTTGPPTNWVTSIPPSGSWAEQ